MTRQYSGQQPVAVLVLLVLQCGRKKLLAAVVFSVPLTWIHSELAVPVLSGFRAVPGVQRRGVTGLQEMRPLLKCRLVGRRKPVSARVGPRGICPPGTHT